MHKWSWLLGSVLCLVLGTGCGDPQQDVDVATSLNNRAGLYFAQGNYAEAEPLYQRSLAIWEKALGPELSR